MKTSLCHALVTGLALGIAMGPAGAAEPPSPEAVLNTYADIALAGYEDSLVTARALDAAIDALVSAPSEATLGAARAAWIAARAPYQQTEVYRFGNAIVDDWEGRVNAWPLDEGLIDYVDASYGADSDENDLYAVNVIANPELVVNGRAIDATMLTPALLSETLHEAEGVEANVATGYHAIEFLLWGQDLNGTEAGSGARPATDFDPEDCTGGNCDRRAGYLKAASTLLVADLEEMVGNWQADGAARAALLAEPKTGLAAILTGMGIALLRGACWRAHEARPASSRSGGGARLLLRQHPQLALLRPDRDPERLRGALPPDRRVHGLRIRDCGDGRYRRCGARRRDPGHARCDGRCNAALRSRAESVEAYDQMIGEGNASGNAVVQAAIDALVRQTRSIERAVAILSLGSIEIEGSDSLDNPNAVFQ